MGIQRNIHQWNWMSSLLQVESADVTVDSDVNFSFDAGTLALIIGIVVGLIIVIFVIAYFCGRGTCTMCDNVCCKGRALIRQQKLMKQQMKYAPYSTVSMDAQRTGHVNSSFVEPGMMQNQIRTPTGSNMGTLVPRQRNQEYNTNDYVQTVNRHNTLGEVGVFRGNYVHIQPISEADYNRGQFMKFRTEEFIAPISNNYNLKSLPGFGNTLPYDIRTPAKRPSSLDRVDFISK